MTTPDRLDVLNRASSQQATAALSACNASPVWVEHLLVGRPYRDVASLLAVAEQAARSLSWDEVRRALDAHPRIGDRAEGRSVEARWSRREQAAVGGTGFYPEVVIVFAVTEPERHHHVPLLLSPFAYSTYRGS